MSIAFYPRLGLFMFGSESSATKAGLGKAPPHSSAMLGNQLVREPPCDEAFLDGFRFDLDDVRPQDPRDQTQP